MDIFSGIGQWFHDLLQDGIDGLGETLEDIINVLPDSPFNLIDNSSVSTYMGWLNWLVPVSQIVAILQVWVVAVGIYYVVVIVLRWIKAID